MVDGQKSGGSQILRDASRGTSLGFTFGLISGVGALPAAGYGLLIGGISGAFSDPVVKLSVVVAGLYTAVMFEKDRFSPKLPPITPPTFSGTRAC